MFNSRHRSRLDQLRFRFDRRAGRSSRSLVEAEALLTSAVERHLATQAEERTATDRLIQAFDLIPQGFVLADRDGRIVFRNRGASGFVDARHSEALVESAIDQLIEQAVHGESETRTLDLFGPPRRAIQLRAGPLLAETEPGSSEPNSAGSGSGADGEDQAPIVGAFVLVEDVSDRRRLDSVRRDFVANISHELKTPVGALGVLAESLVDEEDPAVVRRLADRMQREAFRVADTIDDLLQLSRIESGDLPEPEEIQVRDLVAGAIERTQPAADLRGITVRNAVEDTRLAVLGDKRQLRSALVNLLDNAVKYTDADRRAEVTVGAERDGRFIAISVTDHGMGIPARDLARVFERFYRVDRARSRDTGGTGLGLAIVRHVVQNHDGEVTVTSREGEGSTFVLRLPDGSPVAPPNSTRSPQEQP